MTIALPSALAQFANVGGEIYLPLILGASADEGTLVQEELPGVRLDAYVSWTKWRASRALRAQALISRAAAWLGVVHRATFDGTDVVDSHHILHTVRSILTLAGLESTRYENLALGILNDFAGSLATRALKVPRCLCHGDFCLPNIMWDGERDRVIVIDLEHSVCGNVLHDLCNFVFNLRTQLLYPFISASIVKALESAFWEGYGTTSDAILAAVNAIATARLFYFLLPRRLSRRDRHGWVGSLQSALYGRCFEPAMIERALQSLDWFSNPSMEFVRV